MKSVIYIEGGAPGSEGSKELNARCREGFRKLLEKCGFEKRMPRLVMGGGRNSTFKDFKRASKVNANYLLIDSEDSVADVNQTWAHLLKRDAWEKPAGARDDQVLFMTTCMESWIVADRATLKKHYGQHLRENSLPPLVDIEKRTRDFVQDCLYQATKDCSNCYEKGKKSFEIIGELDPAALKQHLPSFVRAIRILAEKL